MQLEAANCLSVSTAVVSEENLQALQDDDIWDSHPGREFVVERVSMLNNAESAHYRA
jgi:hypothetical protein